MAGHSSLYKHSLMIMVIFLETKRPAGNKFGFAGLDIVGLQIVPFLIKMWPLFL